MRKLRVYVAGPMRGYEKYNFPAFDAARDLLLELGHDPVNPADLDRAIGIDENTTELPEGFIEDALRRDFAAICTCDAIAFLPGWGLSSGALAERRVAKEIGLTIYDIDPEDGYFAPPEHDDDYAGHPIEVIGLSGYAQTGKDTIAEYLVTQGWERVAFADALRDALYALNPIIEAFGCQEQGSLDYRRLRTAIDLLGWDAAKVSLPEVRQLLQRMGTDVGRQLLGDNVWVDIAMRKCKPGGKYVFTDVRFPNEAKAIKDAGGRMWRVERPGTGPVNGHVSETALDDFDFDTTIGNEGDIEHLNFMIGLIL